MATRFQVKRSSVGGVRPTTSDIQPGELAVNINDRILFSANSSTVFEVGSNLTSLAVGNSTVRFTVNTTHIAVSNSMALSANGSNGTSGQVLSSNGTGIYWATPTSTVNTAAQYSWTNTHTFSSNVSFENYIDVKTYIEVESAPTISAGTLTLDLSNSTIFDVALNGNIDTLTITNIAATAARAVNFVLILTADGTPRSVTWPVSFRWADGTAPTITSTNGKRDVFSFLSTDNGTSWNAFTSGQNL